MKIAVAKESEACERRVALVPDTVTQLVKNGLEVLVESGTGERTFFTDADYEKAGAIIVKQTKHLWAEADILLKVSPPRKRDDGILEVDLLKQGAILIGFLNPLGNPGLAQILAERQVTALSMEMVPRTTRAQSMDALSSQASIAGYKAGLIAAAALPKYFPMLTTAAGTIAPAKVFVMGAGVAGLQAIATTRRLGAIVEAFDIRPSVKEEVQSLGARFVEVQLEEETATAGGYAKEISEASKKSSQQVVTDHVKNSDVVITTAQVPGKKAPLLITREMVLQMKKGSVIIDLAAEQGGNCACTDPGKDIIVNGVNIIGPINLPSSMPVHASQLYAKNITSLIRLLIKDKDLQVDFNDDIINAVCITHAGKIHSPLIQELLSVTSAG
ncbi:NAD(P) transhydrogenase alpha subunit [Richelia intracellularis HH01]|uniref:NAD(P) transhydrogenase subunit alpha part 1 n=1 Tax=Richelia intracellularis HH01 TaxID=1165094 RepID=M1X4J5_9NOST|nr:Re/Si-specific NAD(P)(+) transhydrogenase subunit alpha [Richelia intracellularis]CCH66256.1 NAD(P) transhydrogenase alpha subunit [Richelia intracellularis HH01]